MDNIYTLKQSPIIKNNNNLKKNQNINYSNYKIVQYKDKLISPYRINSLSPQKNINSMINDLKGGINEITNEINETDNKIGHYLNKNKIKKKNLHSNVYKPNKNFYPQRPRSINEKRLNIRGNSPMINNFSNKVNVTYENEYGRNSKYNDNDSYNSYNYSANKKHNRSTSNLANPKDNFSKPVDYLNTSFFESRQNNINNFFDGLRGFSKSKPKELSLVNEILQKQIVEVRLQLKEANQKISGLSRGIKVLKSENQKLLSNKKIIEKKLNELIHDFTYNKNCSLNEIEYKNQIINQFNQKINDLNILLQSKENMIMQLNTQNNENKSNFQDIEKRCDTSGDYIVAYCPSNNIKTKKDINKLKNEFQKLINNDGKKINNYESSYVTYKKDKKNEDYINDIINMSENLRNENNNLKDNLQTIENNYMNKIQNLNKKNNTIKNMYDNLKNEYEKLLKQNEICVQDMTFNKESNPKILNSLNSLKEENTILQNKLIQSMETIEKLN